MEKTRLHIQAVAMPLIAENGNSIMLPVKLHTGEEVEITIPHESLTTLIPWFLETWSIAANRQKDNVAKPWAFENVTEFELGTAQIEKGTEQQYLNIRVGSNMTLAFLFGDELLSALKETLSVPDTLIALPGKSQMN